MALGWITKAPVPVILLPKLRASVVMVRLLLPAAMVLAVVILGALSTTLPVKLTASLKVCAPLVVTLLARETVPPALVVTVAASTVELKAVAPVELTMIAPRAPLAPLPTAPVRVTSPLPVAIVKARGVALALSIVLENRTAPFEVVSVTAASKDTAPVKVCEPVVVIVPAKEEVPPTVSMEVPVLLVIVLPDAMTKLPTVTLFCRSRMAAFSRIKLVVVNPSVPAPERIALPSLIVVLPL